MEGTGKLLRGIPQTRWPCRECGGKGARGAKNTGKMYPESVDELIKPHLLEAAGVCRYSFSRAGREDIDALNAWRRQPFVVEAKRPHIRSLDLDALETQITQGCTRVR